MDLLIYAVCLGLGMFFLLIGVAVEHLFRDQESGPLPDPDWSPDQPETTVTGARLWSPTRLAAFVLGFGGVGVAVSLVELTSKPYVSIPLALGGGAAMAVIVQALCRRWFSGRRVE
jgi:hypothetical protein